MKDEKVVEALVLLESAITESKLAQVFEAIDAIEQHTGNMEYAMRCILLFASQFPENELVQLYIEPAITKALEVDSNATI